MSSPLSPLLSPIAGAQGALQLLTETDPASEAGRAVVAVRVPVRQERG
jgi:hypothetical protein